VNLFDASALLCFLRGEEGADVVERELLAGGACSAANWSEVAQKVAAREHDWRPARALLLSYDLTVEPIVMADA
jgi:ribonuclease VapC